MQLLQLLKTILSTLGADKVAQLVPLLTTLLKAVKAKDVTTALLTIMSIIEVLKGTQPSPVPAPGPGPVFAAATDESQFVSEVASCGCDPADAQALADELK